MTMTRYRLLVLFYLPDQFLFPSHSDFLKMSETVTKKRKLEHLSIDGARTELVKAQQRVLELETLLDRKT